jgi:hypothetical protein
MGTKSANVTATGTVVETPCVAHGAQYNWSGGAGELVFRDGGEEGVVVVTLKTQQGADHAHVPFEGGGIQFEIDCHVTMDNVDSVTLFYTTGG